MKSTAPFNILKKSLSARLLRNMDPPRKALLQPYWSRGNYLPCWTAQSNCYRLPCKSSKNTILMVSGKIVVSPVQGVLGHRVVTKIRNKQTRHTCNKTRQKVNIVYVINSLVAQICKQWLHLTNTLHLESRMLSYGRGQAPRPYLPIVT